MFFIILHSCIISIYIIIYIIIIIYIFFPLCSYEVAWSDGSVYSGVTAGHVTPLLLLRTYSTPGHYTATVRYCNNPEDTKFKCCSRLSLPLETR